MLQVCSPLTRALETAERCLAAQKSRGVPFLAIENCRERFGKQYPDARSVTSQLRKRFAQVDFSRLSEEDELHGKARESVCSA